MSFLPLFSDVPLRARTFIRDVKGGAHNSGLGLTLLEVWARSVQCAARGKPSKLFLPWAYLRQIPGFAHPLSPCTFVRFGQADFPRVISGVFFAKIAHDGPQITCGERDAICNPAARQQQLATSCMCSWCVLAMLRRVVCVGACHLSPHHTTYFCCAAAACGCPSVAPWFPQHPRG